MAATVTVLSGTSNCTRGRNIALIIEKFSSSPVEHGGQFWCAIRLLQVVACVERDGSRSELAAVQECGRQGAGVRPAGRVHREPGRRAGDECDAERVRERV